ncbi:MAG TPA: hypothetical protein VGR01_00285 [Burkholderiales bacterium]|jgi:hypothetical protein|nr:hypothetical protein [Burkholderiales bacterium]
MSFADLDDARRHHGALLEIFLHHPGGWADRASLNKIVELCRAAGAAVDDAQCAEQVKIVVAGATDLFSEQAHKKWARSNVSGADFLRLEIMRALHSFSRRLSEMEAARRLGS